MDAFTKVPEDYVEPSVSGALGRFILGPIIFILNERILGFICSANLAECICCHRGHIYDVIHLNMRESITDDTEVLTSVSKKAKKVQGERERWQK